MNGFISNDYSGLELIMCTTGTKPNSGEEYEDLRFKLR